VLLAYGGAAHGALAELGAVSIDESRPRFRRGTITLAERNCAVFLLTHPAHGGWHAAHRALVASLNAQPVTT